MSVSRARLALLAVLAASLGCATDNGGVAGVLVVASVEVTPGNSSVVVNNTTPLTALPKTASGLPVPGRTVAWSSLNPGIATVSNAGVVTGVSPGGPVTIRATVDGINGDAFVTVFAIAINSVTVTPPSNPLVAGQSVVLTATARDAGGAVLPGRFFSWESSDPGIASVSTNGTVLAVSAGGPVTISATSEGKVGTATVTVTPRPADRLGFVQQPTTTAAGAPFNPTVKVAIQDAVLGTVVGATNPVTIALAANPAGATLSGTTTVNAVNGIATFGNLTLDRVGTGYTFLVTSPTLASATSVPFNVTAGAAGRLALTTPPPATAQSGVALNPQPVLQLLDGNGNNVPQAGVVITATLTSGTGSLGGTVTATTNGSGTATFVGLSISGLAGPYVLGFATPGVTGVNSGIITLSAGPAAALLIARQPSVSAQSGVPLAQQPTVQITDQAGNPVAQSGVVVTASLASGIGTLGGSTTATTNAAGLATFTTIAINGVAGLYTLQFAAPGLTPAVSGVIALGAGTATGMLANSVVSQTAAAGTAVAAPPSVRVTDTNGNPVSGAAVTFTLLTGGGSTLPVSPATVTTNAAGVATLTRWTLGTVAGTNNNTVRASLGALTPVVFTASATAGAANLMAANSPTTQSAQVGTAVGAPPSVLVTDQFGNPVAGFAVSFAVTSGGGTVVPAAPATVTTNALGVATVTSWTLGASAGANTVNASAVIPVGSPVTFTATGTAASATNILANSATTQSALVGTAVASPPSVKVTDGIGNPVQGVVVTFAVTLGGGSISGPAAVATDAAGIATVGGWTLGGTPGTNNNTLTASSGTLTGSPVIFTASATVGPAAKLAIIQQPVGGASGAPLTTQPVIVIQDAQGNTVATDNTTQVSVAISSGAGGTLGGTQTVTASSGVATFTDLTLAGTAGLSYVLQFTSSPALTAVSSNSVTVTAGSATHLVITTQPVGGVSGAALTTQPVVAIRDAQNNAVTTDNSTQVSVAIFSGAGGTLGGTQTVTAAGGVATFTNLTLTGTPGVNYVLQFTSSPALTAANSGNVTVTAPPVTQLNYQTQPSSTATNGVAFTQPPVLLAQDAGNNPVSGVLVTATITGSPAGVSFIGTTTVTTDASGLATFTGLGLSGTAGNYTLTFTAGALSSGASNTITLFAGQATKLSITTQPSASATNDVAFAQQPAIQLQDVSGNPVPVSGITVTAVIASGAGTLGGTVTALTNVNGLATFTDLKITGAVGSRTLSFSSGSLTPVVSGTINVVAGAATQLTYQTQPPTTATSGSAFSPQPVLLLRDASNNPVAGVVVTAGTITTITGSGASYIGTVTATTDLSGLAAFGNLGLNGTGDYTIDFTAGALTSPTSNTIALVGAAHHLLITQQPSANADDKKQFTQQPWIQLVDAANNPVAQFGVSITASIAACSPSGATLTGGTAVTTDASGLAVFLTLKINLPGPGTVPADCTLLFTSSGLPPSPDSSPIHVIP